MEAEVCGWIASHIYLNKKSDRKKKWKKELWEAGWVESHIEGGAGVWVDRIAHILKLNVRKGKKKGYEKLDESCHTWKEGEVCGWVTKKKKFLDLYWLLKNVRLAHTLPPPFMCMGWLRLVGSLKVKVFFAKEPYKRDDILQKRPIILRSLLIAATP